MNAHHELSFTGPALSNGGTVLIKEIRTDRSGDTLKLNSPAGLGLDYMRVSRTGNGDLPPSAVIGPARETRSILMLPRNSDYPPTERIVYRVQTKPFEDTPFGVTIEGTVASPTRYYTGFACDPLVRQRYVEYTGLDDSASITISSEICSQHIIQPYSAWHAMAKPSEAASQSWLSNFLARINLEPLVATSGAALRSAVDRAATMALQAAAGLAATTVHAALQDL